MDEVSCLIFDLDQYRYAVEAGAVAEVMDCPPLRVLPGLPAFVVGGAQLRDETVPVIDLHLLLGHPQRPSHATDQVIVIQCSRGRAGLLAEKVTGSRMLPYHGSVRTRDPGEAKPQGWKFIARLVAMEHSLVMVLDSDALLASLQPAKPALGVPEAAADESGLTAPSAIEPSVDYEASAEWLAESLFEEFRHSGLVAVIGWNGWNDELQLRGVQLSQVEEFTEISQLTRLPGCPSHILGQAVARGELVTVVDVRPAFNLDVPDPRLPVTVVVVRQGEERIGIVVDEVREMVTADRFAAPSERPRPFLTGTVPYGRGSLDVLDLPELLSSQAIVVDQCP